MHERICAAGVPGTLKRPELRGRGAQYASKSTAEMGLIGKTHRMSDAGDALIR